jgi:hypothetical protein
VNICRNGFSRLVGMEIHEPSKYLKSLERVKGIEPSYSAWKAAALPLSYTRAGDELTRHAGGLNPPPPVLSEHPEDTTSAGPGP